MASKQKYSDRISDAQVMESGLRNNQATLSRRGLDADFTEKLSESRARAAALNNEQERLKAELKMKTAELDEQLAIMGKLMREARKLVKLDMPQEQWKEFGIGDKR